MISSIKIILKKIVEWYMKAMKIFLFLVKLSVIPIVLLIILSFSPIVPKIYYLIHNYNFSYDRKNDSGCGEIDACIDNIRWEEDDLIISGDYTWIQGTEASFVHGFYKIKEDSSLYLYVESHDNQLGIFGLSKHANAFASEENIKFNFIIKDLPRKDYRIILNNFEQLNFSINGEKEILYEDFCEKDNKSYKNDRCWKYVARKTENPELCFNMRADYNYIENCVIGAVSKKEHVKYCSDDKFKPELRDACYKKLGMKLGDIDICDMMSNRIEADKCFWHIAQKWKEWKNIETCNESTSSKSKGECLLNIAKQTKKLEICNLINYQGIRPNCILTVAIETENPEACDKVQNLITRDHCFKKVSFELQNKEICNKIFISTIRNECIKGENK